MEKAHNAYIFSISLLWPAEIIKVAWKLVCIYKQRTVTTF
jgi:hypothetical protein